MQGDSLTGGSVNGLEIEGGSRMGDCAMSVTNTLLHD
jgi:hypothetical protein